LLRRVEYSRAHDRANLPHLPRTQHDLIPPSQSPSLSPPSPSAPSPPQTLTIDLDGPTLHAVHSDIDATSLLWVPDLKIAVAGDIVYNSANSHPAESLTPALRERWIRAIEKVRSFGPETVVVGHELPGAVDGAWALEYVRVEYVRVEYVRVEYVRVWGRLTCLRG